MKFVKFLIFLIIVGGLVFAGVFYGKTIYDNVIDMIKGKYELTFKGDISKLYLNVDDSVEIEVYAVNPKTKVLDEEVKIEWIITNSDVIQIIEDELSHNKITLTAVKKGQTRVSAKVRSVKISIDVVIDEGVKSIEIDSSIFADLKLGTELELSSLPLTLTPIDKTYLDINWELDSNDYLELVKDPYTQEPKALRVVGKGEGTITLTSKAYQDVSFSSSYSCSFNDSIIESIISKKINSDNGFYTKNQLSSIDNLYEGNQNVISSQIFTSLDDLKVLTNLTKLSLLSCTIPSYDFINNSKLETIAFNEVKVTKPVNASMSYLVFNGKKNLKTFSIISTEVNELSVIGCSNLTAMTILDNFNLIKVNINESQISTLNLTGNNYIRSITLENLSSLESVIVNEKIYDFDLIKYVNLPKLSYLLNNGGLTNITIKELYLDNCIKMMSYLKGNVESNSDYFNFRSNKLTIKNMIRESIWEDNIYLTSNAVTGELIIDNIIVDKTLDLSELSIKTLSLSNIKVNNIDGALNDNEMGNASIKMPINLIELSFDNIDGVKSLSLTKNKYLSNIYVKSSTFTDLLIMNANLGNINNKVIIINCADLRDIRINRSSLSSQEQLRIDNPSNIIYLDLSNNYLETFKLSDFSSAETIILHNNIINSMKIDNVNDITTVLELSYNRLTDISFLSYFKKIEELYLTNNRIESIGVLANFSTLKSLHINNNSFYELNNTSYSNLKMNIASKLVDLSIGSSNISSSEEQKIVDFIKGCNNLESLRVVGFVQRPVLELEHLVYFSFNGSQEIISSDSKIILDYQNLSGVNLNTNLIVSDKIDDLTIIGNPNVIYKDYRLNIESRNKDLTITFNNFNFISHLNMSGIDASNIVGDNKLIIKVIGLSSIKAGDGSTAANKSQDGSNAIITNNLDLLIEENASFTLNGGKGGDGVYTVNQVGGKGGNGGNGISAVNISTQGLGKLFVYGGNGGNGSDCTDTSGNNGGIGGNGGLGIQTTSLYIRENTYIKVYGGNGGNGGIGATGPTGATGDKGEDAWVKVGYGSGKAGDPGYPGGQGGKGGDAGKGGMAITATIVINESANLIIYGGTAGKGGKGGQGGRGGTGGQGGSSINNWLYGHINEGHGGNGGTGGQGGVGGNSYYKIAASNIQIPGATVVLGNDGVVGERGNQGLGGYGGSHGKCVDNRNHIADGSEGKLGNYGSPGNLLVP
jgi:hypothetical protein